MMKFKYLIYLVLFSFLIILTSCSKKTPDTIADEMIKNNNLKGLENFCENLTGEERSSNFQKLFDIYISKKDFDSAERVYLKKNQKILFSDDFISNRNNWLERDDADVDYGVKNGKFYFNHKSKNSYFTWPSFKLEKDINYRITVKMKKISGVNNFGYAVSWGLKDVSNYCEFGINGFGQYYFGGSRKGKFKNYIGWTQSSHINKLNSANKITIEKNGNLYKLFINDRFVNKIKYGDLSGNKIAFHVNSKIEVEYDSILIEKLPNIKDIQNEILSVVLEKGYYYSYQKLSTKYGFSERSTYLKIAEANVAKGEYKKAVVNLSRSGWSLNNLKNVKIFEEKFETNRHGWDEKDSKDYFKKIQNGKFIFRKKSEKGVTFAWPDTIPDFDETGDYKIEVELEKVSGKNNNVYGIAWGIKNTKNCFYFGISGNGSYVAGKWIDNKLHDIFDWTSSGYVKKKNAKNSLAVEKSGNKYRFYVNGHIVNEIPYQKMFGKKVGIVLQTKVRVDINRITVTKKPPKIAYALSSIMGGNFIAADKKETAKNVNVQSKRWAVVIGISEYEDSHIPSLRYAKKDATAFYSWLTSSKGGRYPPSQVLILTDKKATGRNIRNALFTWLKRALEEDIVTIYFAGHGSPDSPDSTNNLFLLPYDAQYDDIASSGFPMWDIETAIKRFIKAKKVVIIADACHSGGVGQTFEIARRSNRGLKINKINAGFQNLSEIGDGVCVISASDDKQMSQESSKWGKGHGVFTYFLLQGLKGKADYNKDKNVNLGELMPYISQKVRRATRNAQSPIVSGKFDPALSIGR
ncbi:MAG: hypothetical protein GY760_07800 [Deltaproteobacteria bacterium]|nr:hypothetical protein [Deltaproteobacteria bacterium]